MAEIENDKLLDFIEEILIILCLISHFFEQVKSISRRLLQLDLAIYPVIGNYALDLFQNDVLLWFLNLPLLSIFIFKPMNSNFSEAELPLFIFFFKIEFFIRRDFRNLYGFYVFS